MLKSFLRFFADAPATSMDSVDEKATSIATPQYPAAAYRRKIRFTKASPSFQLVHRSQRDPLIADENAPRFVLRPTNAAAEQIARTSKVRRSVGPTLLGACLFSLARENVAILEVF